MCKNLIGTKLSSLLQEGGMRKRFEEEQERQR